MSRTPLFRKFKDNTLKTLRFLFEDKEMRGDRFDDLKCSKSGAIWVKIEDIQASDSYQKARDQSDRVLGIKSHMDTDSGNSSDIKLDYLGRILLPSNLRRKITNSANLEFRELSDGSVIILISTQVKSLEQRRYKIGDFLEKSGIAPSKIDNS